MEPGCLAQQGGGSASFRCLWNYAVPIGQRRGSGAGPGEYPKPRPVVARPAAVGGLTSRRRESGARPPSRLFSDSLRPAPRCACSLVPQAISRAPDCKLLWPRLGPAPRALTHAPHANAANPWFLRVFRVEALAGFSLHPRAPRTRPRVVAPALPGGSPARCTRDLRRSRGRGQKGTRDVNFNSTFPFNPQCLKRCHFHAGDECKKLPTKYLILFFLPSLGALCVSCSGYTSVGTAAGPGVRGTWEPVQGVGKGTVNNGQCGHWPGRRKKWRPCGNRIVEDFQATLRSLDFIFCDGKGSRRAMINAKFNKTCLKSLFIEVPYKVHSEEGS